MTYNVKICQESPQMINMDAAHDLKEEKKFKKIVTKKTWKKKDEKSF